MVCTLVIIFHFLLIHTLGKIVIGTLKYQTKFKSKFSLFFVTILKYQCKSDGSVRVILVASNRKPCKRNTLARCLSSGCCSRIPSVEWLKQVFLSTSISLKWWQRLGSVSSGCQPDQVPGGAVPSWLWPHMAFLGACRERERKRDLMSPLLIGH